MTIRTIFAAGAAVAALVVLGACGGDASLDRGGQGKVAIVMSAAGGGLAADGTASLTAADASKDSASHGTCQSTQALQGADVTFSSILARSLDGKLIDVTIDLPVTVDMLSLGNGKSATLPVGFLPPGTYDQLVVVMTRVEFTLSDGTKVAITPPGGGWTAVVRVAAPFTVAEGETTTITLKFRRDVSFGCGSGGWEWHPRFDCDR